MTEVRFAVFHACSILTVFAMLASCPAAAPAQQEDWGEHLPAVTETEAVIDKLTRINWDPRAIGLEHIQRLMTAVRHDPARFAPVIRDRLLRLPDTLDEFTLDDPRWVVNRDPYQTPDPPLIALTQIIELLGREHAEPILRDLFDRAHPLEVEARERLWKAQDARIAAGRVGDPEANEAWWIWTRIGSASGHALRAAMELHSPIFIDDAIAFLQSDRPAERARGANMAAYVLDFADERPDAVEIFHNAAAILAASNNPRDREAARSLSRQLAERDRQEE